MAMVAAALITAGCSSDDDAVETAPELRAISFTGGVNTEEVQTSRAEDEGLEKYSNQFIVYAYKNGNKELVMNGYAVNWIPISAGSTSTNTHDWEYVGQGTHADHPQVIKYWDEKAENYSFFGFVPARTTNPSEAKYYPVRVDLPTESSPNPQIQFSLPYCAEFNGKYTTLKGYEADGVTPIFVENLDKEDIPLVSRLTRITKPIDMSKPVRMEFVPPYARVKIAFERISTVDNTPISGITFKPNSGSVPSHADLYCSCDLTQGTLSVRLDNTVTGSVFEGGIPFDPLSKTDEETGELVGKLDDANKIYYANPYFMLFPTPTASTPVDFTLSAWIGSGLQECVVPAAYMRWEMGYEYTYVFKITKAGLNLINVIKVGIKSWESIGTEDTEFHNW